MATAIQFPAGVTNLVSKVQAIANWRESNLVRWDDGVTLRPVGGWEEIPYGPTPFASRCRAIHRWQANNGIIYTAYLCEHHCYVDTGGNLTDITPEGGFGAAAGDAAGYGEKQYSAGLYGTPRPGISSFPPFSSAWTLDNWGEDLVAMISYDGRLFRWKPSAPTVVLTAVPNAPVANHHFVVTNERHLMLMQMGGQFQDFGWCSSEDIEDWDFADPLNTAGMFTVEPASPIVGSQLSDMGIVIFTPAMSYLVSYIGLPYIYRKKPIGKVPIPLSTASTATIPDGVVWISVEGFWLYNGSTSNVIPCTVWEYVLDHIDLRRSITECTVVDLSTRGEIWWFWVSKHQVPGVDPTRNSRYVCLDYRSRVWTMGRMKRDCGYCYGNDRNPIMSDGFKIYKHETGFAYTDAEAMPYLESQTLNSGGGDNLMTINKILPDIAGDKNAVRFSFAVSVDRTDYTKEWYTPQRSVNGYGWVDIRETGRDMRLRIDVVTNTDWQTVGPILFDLKKRGKKAP
ncbi:MAG: hypothetical protein ABWZ17_02060 [Candidatus Binatia bacterium]